MPLLAQQQWMKEESNDKNVIFQIGDIDVFADNTQRKVKTNRVKENGVRSSGITTNVVFIQSNPPSNIQYIESFSPVNWFSKTTDCVNKIINLEKMLNDIFPPYRFMKQQKIFEEVSFDNYTPPNDHAEEKLLIDTDLFYVCENCMSKVSHNQINCIVCGFNPSNLADRESLYGEVPDNHPDDSPSIKLAEIIPVNPNSYESMKIVLQDQSEVGKKESGFVLA